MTDNFFTSAIFGVVRFKNKQSSLIGPSVLLVKPLITACVSDSGNPCPLIRDSVNSDSDELCMHCASNSVTSFWSAQGNGSAGSAGAAQRNPPKDGTANSTPRNTVSKSWSVFCQRPNSRPCSTSVLGRLSIVLASVDSVVLISCPVGIQDNWNSHQSSKSEIRHLTTLLAE